LHYQPSRRDGSADLSYVLKVANDIGEMMTEYKVIVNKSTVPVGTADRVRETISLKQRFLLMLFPILNFKRRFCC
jgi:UDP-glucose 6-dehydrogenase